MKDLLYATDERGRKLFFDIKEDKNTISLTLKKETFIDCKELWLLPELGKAKIGDEGFYILPRNIEMSGDPLIKFTPRADNHFSYDKAILSIYGIKTPALTALIRIERSYRYWFDVLLENGVYRVMPHFDFTVNDKVYDDIRLEIVLFGKDDGYAQMAKHERELRLSRKETPSLAEKCQREAVEYARKFPLIRIRMGWKTSPSVIRHQTAENEPEMFVACSFDRVCDIANELKKKGVKGAELQLVGWNISGHDGRFPQLMPPDHRLGGMYGLKKCIEHVKKLGYRISLHTNTIDAVEVADCFDWNDICVQNGGYLQMGHYSGGLAYHVCPIKQLKNAKRDLPELSKLGLNGLHFTDVISIALPDTCTSEDHPCNQTQGISAFRENMSYTSELFGGFSSEGAFDFAIGDLDFALYVCFGDGFGKKMRPFCELLIPFFELIYHGVLLYNPSSPTVNYPIKDALARLRVIMNGGRPSFYFFSKFRSGGAANWMGTTDFVSTTDEELSFAAEKIANAAEEYSQLKLDDRQLVYMSDYEILDNGLETACYEDGVKIVGNFSDKEASYQGVSIPAFDFKIIRN